MDIFGDDRRDASVALGGMGISTVYLNYWSNRQKVRILVFACYTLFVNLPFPPLLLIGPLLWIRKKVIIFFLLPDNEHKP